MILGFLLSNVFGLGVPRESGDDPDTDSGSYNSGYSRRGFVAGMFVIVIAGLIILN